MLILLGPEPARVRLAIAPDGSAQMDGAILVVAALDGPMPNDPGPPRRLVAEGAAAAAQCADANANGRAGLIRAAAEFVDTGSGARIPVVLEALPGQDLDASGHYDVIVQIGAARATRTARVRLDARGQSRRGRRAR